MLGIIKRSSISGELLKARADERLSAEREWKIKTELIIKNQQGIHELQIQRMESKIDSLNRIIEKSSDSDNRAHDKEQAAKKIYLAAKNIVNKLEFEIESYLEGNAALLGQFRKIKDEADAFSVKMIDDK